MPLALLAPAALVLAQGGTEPFLRVDAPVVHLGTLDPRDGSIAPGGAPGAAEAPALDYDNTAQSGFFTLPGTGVALVDWGVYAPSGPGTLYAFTIGYATHASSPSITVRLLAGTEGHCADGEPGLVLGTFPLTGLPGSPDGVQTVYHTLTVDVRLSGIQVPAGPIGWEYRFFDVQTGPLLVNGPLGLPAPNGTEDAYDRYDLALGGCATQDFGGCLPPFVPCASFYLALEADDGATPWSATPYGSGVNPPGSLTVLGGSAQIGETLVVGVDNPLGTQPPGSLAFVAVSLLPDPGYPGGTLIPGFGMLAPGAPGELLLHVAPGPLLDPVIGPSVWAGAGFPASFPLSIPQNANLIGKHVFAQGVIVDTAAAAPIRYGFTEALDVLIGF